MEHIVVQQNKIQTHMTEINTCIQQLDHLESMIQKIEVVVQELDLYTLEWQ
jgi:chaperonin cofactor prefoldin